jgi:uncharacterized membrane protein
MFSILFIKLLLPTGLKTSIRLSSVKFCEQLPIGGIGVAATGTAVGITLGPFIAIGAGVGLTAYGLYWLGKQVGQRGKKPPEDKP